MSAVRLPNDTALRLASRISLQLPHRYQLPISLTMIRTVHLACPGFSSTISAPPASEPGTIISDAPESHPPWSLAIPPRPSPQRERTLINLRDAPEKPWAPNLGLRVSKLFRTGLATAGVQRL